MTRYLRIARKRLFGCKVVRMSEISGQCASDSSYEGFAQIIANSVPVCVYRQIIEN